MTTFSQHLASAKTSIANTLKQACAHVEKQLPDNIEDAWKSYLASISSTSKDDLIKDFSNLRVTPATVTISVTTVATLIIFSKIFGSSTPAPSSTKTKKKKKLTKAQKANNEIQKILDFVEETYVPQIDDYLQNYASLTENDRQYKYNYYEEMLLKELLKLDSVDIGGSEVLRDNRKKVIRFVQDHQKRLDTFKRDHL